VKAATVFQEQPKANWQLTDTFAIRTPKPVPFILNPCPTCSKTTMSPSIRSRKR
jgi:hypothetical protein